MLVVSALLAILAGVNMYMIYRFIFKKRRKKLAVFFIMWLQQETCPDVIFLLKFYVICYAL